MTRVVSAISFAALAALFSPEASAIEYPWCAEFGGKGGATNCGFVSYEQCRASIMGVGGDCRQNLFYRGGPVYGADVARPRNAKKKPVRRVNP